MTISKMYGTAVDFFHFTCHLFSFRIGFVYIYNYTEQNRNLQ